MLHQFAVALAFLCLTASGQAPPTEGISSRLMVKDGQKIHYVMTDDTTVTVSGQAVEKSSESREFTLAFGKTREDRTRPAEMRYGRIYGWVINEEGEKIEYDSLEAPSTGVRDIDVRMSLVGKPMSTRFDERGRMVHFEGMQKALFGESPAVPDMENLDAGALDGFALLFAGFPDRAIAKGETWKEPFDVNLMGMTIKGDTHLTLKGAVRDDIVIATKGAYAVDMKAMPDMEDAKPSTMSATGVRMISKTTGMTSQASWEQTLNLPMAAGGVDEPIIISVKSNSKVATLAQPTKKTATPENEKEKQ